MINKKKQFNDLSLFYSKYKDEKFLTDCKNANQINSRKFTTKRCVDQRLPRKEKHLLIQSRNDFNSSKSFFIGCKPYMDQFGFDYPQFVTDTL